MIAQKSSEVAVEDFADDLVRQGKVRALGEAATFATADDLNTSQATAAANA